MSEKREPKFWSCDDFDGDLSHTDWWNAIDECYEDTPIHDWPDKVDVYGYTEMRPDVEETARDYVESVVEFFGENYGPFDEPTPPPTAAMYEAGRVFIAKMIDEYRPFGYENITTKTVNMADFVKAAHDLNEWLDKDRRRDLFERYPELKKWYDETG